MSSMRAKSDAGEGLVQTEWCWKFAEETHQYLRDTIRLTDQKAAFFFAGITAVMAFLYKVSLMQKWIKLPGAWDSIDMLSFLSSVGFSVSALSCLVTVLPRIKGATRGYVFFESIAAFESRQEYANDVRSQMVDVLINAKLCHVHDLAVVCKQKYFALKVGHWSGLIGFLAMLLLLLFAPPINY